MRSPLILACSVVSLLICISPLMAQEKERDDRGISGAASSAYCDSVEFLPAAPMNMYVKGSAITLRARFLLSDTTVPMPVVARVRLYRRDDPITHTLMGEWQDTVIMTPGEPVWKSYALASITLQPGAYSIDISGRLEVDRQFSRTIWRTFHIGGGRDMVAINVLEPVGVTRQGDTLPLVVRFYNLGVGSETDVKVYAAIPNRGYSDTVVISGAWPSLTHRDVAFKPFVAEFPGSYAITSCALPAEDDVSNNNCVDNHYFTAMSLAEFGMESPLLGGSAPASESIQSIDDSIAVRAAIVNNGMHPALPSRVYVSIGYGTHHPIYSKSVPSDTLPRGGRQIVELPKFKAPLTGRFRVRAQAATNDTLYLNDTTSWWFVVVRYAKLSTVAPAPDFTRPAPGSTIQAGVATEVEASFIGEAMGDIDATEATVQIRDASGVIVYDEKRMVIGISPERVPITTQSFPQFTPATGGRHCATAWITYPYDTVRADDTVRWCFTVQGSSSVDEHERALRAGYSLSVQPNPSSGTVTLRYRTPDGVGWRAVLYDVSGRPVRLCCDDCGGGEGSMEIVLEDLPSGRYTMTLESTTGERISEPVMIRK